MADAGEKSYIAKESTSQEILVTTQGALDLIGASGDSGNSTVMGKLNTPNIIKSVQRGIIADDSADASVSATVRPITVNIARINPLKSIVVFNNGVVGAGQSSATNIVYGMTLLELTETTMVVQRGYYGRSNLVCGGSYQIVEFY